MVRILVDAGADPYIRLDQFEQCKSTGDSYRGGLFGHCEHTYGD